MPVCIMLGSDGSSGFAYVAVRLGSRLLKAIGIQRLNLF